MKKLLPALLLLGITLVSFEEQPMPEQKTVTGTVISPLNEGIKDAYIYVVAGEEETLSTGTGKFTIKTWQPLPVVLVIEHVGYKKQRFVIKDAGAPLVIKLSDRKG